VGFVISATSHNGLDILFRLRAEVLDKGVKDWGFFV